ncbi:ThuA domain-containing protein [Labilibacter marinus]|uniref:ThuA domain-containing protein n=1 Tax=Labilibacter marinus TaxID=1477105 RepID=UPI0009501F3A|nr:ThuA domain-containing protein [Labilibacter marinus]
MKKIHIYPLLLVLTLILASCGTKKYDALIVTGQSNNSHNWKASHTTVKQIIENTDLFTVDVAISPEQGGDMSTFSPNFKSYDVVIVDYDGDSWSDETKANFESYVKNGGGVVVFHGANNSFPEWKEFNKMTALGGWKGRTEKDGPYVYWSNDKIIKDTKPGKGGSHGKKNAFVIDTRQAEHPIMQGLPLKSMHTTDELYGKLRGPAENMTVLATAYSNPKTNGTGKHEPVLFTIDYGKGRIFHNVLGHVDKSEDMIAYKSAYFIYTMQRGTEWAATGKVTQVVPEDLPNLSTPLVLPAYKQFTLEGLFKNARKYKVGQSKKYLNLISQRIKNHSSNAEYMANIEGKMIQLLSADDCTADAKNYICREISWMGSDKALAVLKTLSSQEETSEMAKYAIDRLTQK